jgi:hypothetical protein
MRTLKYTSPITKGEKMLSDERISRKSKLLSKDCIDRMKHRNKKPSVVAEGLNQLRDTTPESTNDEDSHILAHGRFSRKEENS